MHSKEEYIGIVLSQIQHPGLKSVVDKQLREKIDEMLQDQYLSDLPEERSIRAVLAEMGDPVKLGQYYLWLYNLVDLS